MMNYLRSLILLTVLLGMNRSTLAPKDKSSKKDKSHPSSSKKNSGSSNLSAAADNSQGDKLAPEDLTFELMLGQNMTSIGVKGDVYEQTVLAYVTPWNNKGYDHAKYLGAKFDIISPVWYQLKRVNGQVEFAGLQDTDSSWMQEVRASNPAVKIVPRILFDGWKSADLNALFASEMTQTAVVHKITTFIQSHNFDGFVCEILLQVGFPFKSQAMHFLSHLGGLARKQNLMLVVPLPAPIREDGSPVNFFTVADFRKLRAMVDYFNVMTYDYSSGREPGPVSPASWITSCILYYTKDLPAVERSKFLLGMNFYGYKYYTNNHKVEAITGTSFLELLNKHNTKTKVQWDENAMEHVFQFGSSEKVYYPTLHSVKLRLQLAEKLNVGVAIWDLGQGLDHFLNLF